MHDPTPSDPMERLVGQTIVIDLRSPYVCLGTLTAIHGEFFELTDADLHDFRDSAASRENYLVDSRRLGIRRNRQRVLVRRHDVVAVTRFAEIVES